MAHLKNVEHAAGAKIHRAKEKAERGAEKTRSALLSVGAILVAAFAFVAGVLPWLFGAALHLTSVVLIAVGGGAGALGLWFRHTTDDKHERIVWLLVIAAGVTALLFFWGRL